jgi:hypothetical protein
MWRICLTSGGQIHISIHTYVHTHIHTGCIGLVCGQKKTSARLGKKYTGFVCLVCRYCMDAYVSACMCTCICVCQATLCAPFLHVWRECMCVRMYVYMYTHICICVYIYTHTCIGGSPWRAKHSQNYFRSSWFRSAHSTGQRFRRSCRLVKWPVGALVWKQPWTIFTYVHVFIYLYVFAWFVSVNVCAQVFTCMGAQERSAPCMYIFLTCMYI